MVLRVKKLIVLGDYGVGKTSMLITYTTKIFPSEYIPYVFDSWAVDVKIEAEMYRLGLFDTVGGEDYDRLRPLSYPQTDVFLICFRVASRASLENIRDKWVPEVRHFCPDVPFIIVAMQIDLRDDSEVVKRLASEKQRLVSTQEGERPAHELGAAKYLECSSLMQKGVDDVFYEAIITTLESPVAAPRRRIRKCVVV
ncbi:small GTPase Cdc42 [Mycena albidolilacea]|uniref:Small GTPase Cdc42 n=1 Tax=Mycena albidolilacea TaxID=1033008 RepID=A0AAD7AIR5_9AGAR|nr:small GTPase Cdc42 [Mycena albidolilacea]